MKVGTQQSKESTFRGIYKPTKCGPFVFWSSLVCNMGLVWFLVLEIIRRKKKRTNKTPSTKPQSAQSDSLRGNSKNPKLREHAVSVKVKGRVSLLRILSTHTLKCGGGHTTNLLLSLRPNLWLFSSNNLKLRIGFQVIINLKWPLNPKSL